MKFGINQSISQTITQLSCIQLETPSSRLWNFWWIKTYTTFNKHLASFDWAKTIARRDEKHLSLRIWCGLYWRFYVLYIYIYILQAYHNVPVVRQNQNDTVSIILISFLYWHIMVSLIARFMGPTWGPSGAGRTQVGPMLGPMLAPWTLLSGMSTM